MQCIWWIDNVMFNFVSFQFSNESSCIVSIYQFRQWRMLHTKLQCIITSATLKFYKFLHLVLNLWVFEQMLNLHTWSFRSSKTQEIKSSSRTMKWKIEKVVAICHHIDYSWMQAQHTIVFTLQYNGIHLSYPIVACIIV